MRKARIAIALVIDSALETTRPVIEAEKHELTVSVPSEPLWIDGDLTRPAQVVSNSATPSLVPLLTLPPPRTSYYNRGSEKGVRPHLPPAALRVLRTNGA